jgi:translation initiation factor 1
MTQQSSRILFLGPDKQQSEQAKSLFEKEALKAELGWDAICGEYSELSNVQNQASLLVILHNGIAPKLHLNTSIKFESWNIGTPEDELLQQNISRLVVRLILQGGRRTPIAVSTPNVVKDSNGSKAAAQAMVRVGLESKGRGGKKVTVITGLPLDDTGFDALTTKLKRTCGTGGTFKDGQVEIQGDHRDKLIAELQKLGYKPKRTGG